MKIIKLRAENVKRLRVVEITPDGAVVQVTGANGSGKSSVLDAIFFALAGKKAIDPVPVRRGADEALIELDLGKIKVTRHFSADGGTSLVVEAEDGARYGSPQTMLDKLLGSLSFDPLEFTRLDSRGQSGALRRLVKLDVDVDQIQRENAVDFNARTGVNRQVKELAARVKALGDTVPKEMPAPVDVTALIGKMQMAGEFNAAIERQQMMWDQEDREIEQTKDALVDLDAHIADLMRERHRLTTIRQAQDDNRSRRPNPARRVDVDAMRHEIEVAQATNKLAESAVRQRDEWVRLEEELAKLEEQALQLTETIDGRNRTVREAIAAAKMPIEDLEFSDNFDVLYKGLPFFQASSAEQLRVSVAIAMAMNPRLRVLRIKDGSLLDANSLRILAESVEAAGFQCWIESVDTSGKVGVYLEDGAVAAVNTEPAEVA